MSKMPSTLRLDRLLANLGYGSRAEMHMLIENGDITLDGVELEAPNQHIPISRDLTQRMQVRGEPLDHPPGLVVMMNKPLGVTCSHKDVGPLVYSLLPERWRRRDPALSTIGRLDKETSGLLILTDDGMLLHRVISPKNHVSKRYLVTLDRPMEGHEAELFAAGTLMLESEEKPLAPAQLEVLSPTTAYLTITEGRYHQVRRMFAAVGNHVVALHRDRMGRLELPKELPAGALRILTPEDINQLIPSAKA